MPSSCLVRQDEGPPHSTVLPRELKGQVEPQLDEYVPARQTRKAPVHRVLSILCISTYRVALHISQESQGCRVDKQCTSKHASEQASRLNMRYHKYLAL